MADGTLPLGSPWSNGIPLQPGMARYSDLLFTYHLQGGMDAVYQGQILIVPEPATATVLALAGLAAVRRRRR